MSQHQLYVSRPYEERDEPPQFENVPGTRKRRCLWCDDFTCTRRRDWERHVLLHHCEDCNKYCTHQRLHACLRPQMRGGHIDANQPIPPNRLFKEISRAHRGVLRVYRALFQGVIVEIEEGMKFIESSCFDLLKSLLDSTGPLIVSCTMEILMERDKDSVAHRKYMYFNAKSLHVLNEEQIPHILKQFTDKIISDKNTFLYGTSSWRVVKLNYFELKVGRYDAFQGSAPESYIEMPTGLKHKRGFINFRNDDQLCFEYCIVAHIFMDEVEEKNALVHPGDAHMRHAVNNWKKWRPYIYSGRIDFSDVIDGVELYGNLELFEKRNKISVNVFSHEGHGKIIMARKSTFKAVTKRQVNLFLIRSEESKKSHFVLITDLSKFLGHVRPNVKRWYCQSCINHFPSLQTLARHTIQCREESQIPYEFPSENYNLKFRKWCMKAPIIYIVYFHWEFFDKPLIIPGVEHIPLAFSLVVVERSCKGAKVVETDYYCGESPVKVFFDKAFALSTRLITKVRQTNNLVKPSEEDLKKHLSSERCEFCDVVFSCGDGGFESSKNDRGNHFYMEEIEENMLDEMESRRALEALMCESDSEEEMNHSTALPDNSQRQSTPQGNVPRNAIHASYAEKMRRKAYDHCHHCGRFRFSLCIRCNLSLTAKQELLFIGSSDTMGLHHIARHLNEGSEHFEAREVQVQARNAKDIISLSIRGKNSLPSLVTKYGDSAEACEKDISNCGRRRVKIKILNGKNIMIQDAKDIVRSLQADKDTNLNLFKESLFQFYPSYDYKEDSLLHACEDIRFCHQNMTSAEDAMQEQDCNSKKSYEDILGETVADDKWNLLCGIHRDFNIKKVREMTRYQTCVQAALTATCYESCRSNSINEFGLDIAYSSTMAAYSWQLWLHQLDKEVEFIRDAEMIKMLESNCRGGLSGATRKLFRCNSERAPNYNPFKRRVHLASFDKNSMYPFCLLNWEFGTNSYEWMVREELDSLDFSDANLDVQTGYGYIIECKIDYTEDAQDLTHELPLMPHKASVHLTQLPERQRKIWEDLNGPNSYMTEPKLMLTCEDRDHYVVHYKTLCYYISMGCKLVHVYRGFKFKQEKIFASYIEYLVKKRKEAKSESLAEQLKSQMNTLYGMTLANNKANLEFKFVDNDVDANLWLASHRLQDFSILNENLSMFLLKPKRVLQCNYLLAGFTTLDLSKAVMYDGYFGELKSIFQDDIKLINYETDGITCAIYDDNKTMYTKLWDAKEKFDFSKIPADHPLISDYKGEGNLRTENKGVAGLWKICNVDHYEICALRSRNYSILNFKNDLGTSEIELKESKKCSGIPQDSLSNITHNMYKSIIKNDQEKIRVSYKETKSYDQNVFTMVVDKLAYHALDLSRQFPNSSDPNESYPFGYYKYKCKDDELATKRAKL